MAHMLLIIEPVGQRLTRSEAEGREVYDRMLRWGDSLRARGLLLASESLKSQSEASRVSTRAGKAQVVDGPFAEAKEMVGGFFLIDSKTREQAVALAAECPAAQWATVEVRSLAPCYE
ncbi:YciI family protein [Piscinibacter sp. XHJ-5]|uniref:YciI family protein n=1 Tax=Piscinibacter sp. XHJ-5 TaxID=3037797 RepID=UPI002452A150|nr:YciI family protein [Piscinibacter sp. XHJ-5]